MKRSKRAKILQISVYFLFLVSLFGMFLLPNLTTFKDSFGLNFIGDAPQPGVFSRQFAYISGAVAKPGVYELVEDVRIQDLIKQAGGFTKDVDSEWVNSQLNLAARVEDEDHIFVPKQSKTLSGQALSAKAGAFTNLNTASKDELMALPGVGSATADKIIQARPFKSIQDLLNVSGIGESKFNSLKSLVTV